MQPFELWLPFFALVLTCLGARRAQGSWVAVGPLFSLYYTFVFFLCLLLPEYTIWEGAAWWFAGNVLVFALGTTIGMRLSGQKIRAPLPAQEPPKLLLFLIASSALGFVYTLIMQYLMQDLNDTRLRYQIFLPFNYLAPLVGGIYLASGPWKKRWKLAAISLLPETLTCLVGSGRSGLITMIAFFCSGYFPIAILFTRGQFKLFTKRNIAAGSALAAVVFLLSLVTTHFRSVTETGMPTREVVEYRDALDREALQNSWKAIAHGYSGGVPAFSIWFRRVWDGETRTNSSYGAFFVVGPLNFFEIMDRLPMDSVEVEPGVFTNVYTMFRPMIDEFTLFGCVPALFALGVLGGWVYQSVANGSLLRIPLLVVCYNECINPGLYFKYNSVVVAYVLITAYMYWWHRRESAARVKKTAVRFPVRARPAAVRLQWQARAFPRRGPASSS